MACRAAEAMVVNGYQAAFEAFWIDVPQKKRRGVFPLHAELLVEVAVVDFASPADAQSILAHQAIDGSGVEGFDQQLRVSLQLPLTFEPGGKAPDGHIGEGIESVEIDIEALLQLTSVVSFKFGLVRRKKVAIRIVHEIERKFSHATVTELVQQSKGPDTGIKDAIAPLGIDIVEFITRHRGDDFYAVGFKKIGQPIIARFEENREVAPVYYRFDLRHFPELPHQISKIRRHLRGASGQVYSVNFGTQ